MSSYESMSLPPQTNARSLARAFSLSATTATVACPVPQGTLTSGAQGTSNHKSAVSSSSSQSQLDDARPSANGGKTKERSARGYEADITGLDSNFTALITAPTQAKRAVGAAHGMKLWMMVCAKDVEQFAYTKPGLWVKMGPTSFSYRGGLDLTPSKPTAESWGNKLYDNDIHGGKCVVYTDPQSNTKHEKAMIEYTVQDPNGQLKMLDLDALARDPAQMKKLAPGVPPQNLVEWWFKESTKLTAAYGVPNMENNGIDALYKRADIVAG
ncbi:hypothetical protein F5890DRAFT_1568051 [Lentinula detonsa]|uniref:Uncharacterized protein n=1 Tax=Lentinula detonsa TaxID=2804962 RepID=A0AA38PUA4_9AGAR|nr:hypothetical protein F5890DRAFT_1568051 [Lentinula detonsa]